MAHVPTTRQTDRAADLVIAEQSAIDTLPAANSGVRVPFSVYNGIQISQTRIPDPANNKDGMTGASQLGRTGYQLSGLQGPVLVGAYDLLLQGAMRNAFTAAASLDQTGNLGQITVTSNVVTFASGNPITEGVRVGQFHEYSAGLAAADLNKPLLVIGATATTITYAGSLTDVAVAADFTMSIKKHVTNGTERWPFAVEDVSEAVDISEVMGFALMNNATLSGSGQAPAQLALDLLGVTYEKRSGGDAPYFTTVADYPSTSEFITTPGLKMILNGAYDVPYSSFSLQLATNAFTDDTNRLTPVDIGQGVTAITGSLTILDDATAQSTFDLALADSWNDLAFEGVDPNGNFIGIALPRVKLTNPSKSQRGADRFGTRTFQIEAARDIRGGAYAATMAVLSTD